MAIKKLPVVCVKLDKIVGGGQSIATEKNGRKLFVWGGLPDETVEVQLTKKRAKMAEGYVVNVINPSPNRIKPLDETSYLSTSPWQIMDFLAEQHYKAALIEEAFELHNIILPDIIKIYSNDKQYAYRNKMEFSWWWNKEKNQLDLAFFKRGGHGKMPVEGSSLARPGINKAAIIMRDILRKKPQLEAFMLKTLLVRCDAKGSIIMQLYVKEPDFTQLSDLDFCNLKEKANVTGVEIIFSESKSPASVITKRLQSWGVNFLSDLILNINFRYAADSFFQINIPIYQQALKEIKKWIPSGKPVIDLYSGVGTIGLTIGSNDVTMIESNEFAIREMKNNIKKLNREKTARAVFASSEKSLNYISKNSTVIIDPPRAGLHNDIIKKILSETPERVIYLSCNPVTQARDAYKLLDKYKITYHNGFNFFPRTPHIEHLLVLDLK